MNTTPLITIFVRHGLIDGKPCKYTDDETSKRCNCRKHLRWTRNGVQYRKQANTRSWAEAELVKRELEDQLSGRVTAPVENEAKQVSAAIEVFLEDKRVQGVTAGVLEKYTRELARLREFCDRQGVYTVQGITREMLTGYCATWEKVYPSTQTRGAVRTRCRGFLKFCFETRWLDRIPQLTKIKVDEPETLPLTVDEYNRLLDASVHFNGKSGQLRAMLQLMRHSGLAISDALKLPKASIQHDAERGIYRVRTKRTKTGTHVSVPIHPSIAEEILAVPNNGPYIFWDGESDIVKTWTKYMIAPVFKLAKITSDGYMVSHRLRDTFAVDLLEKGVPMEEVSRLLGHLSIKTTERSYAKWSKGRQDRVDALITGTWSPT